MKYREFRDIAHKGSDETYYIDKFVFRRISVFGSYLLSFTGVRPNAITLVSLLFSLTAVWFFMQTDATSLIIGCVLIFAYHYLDHVDGELARYYYATQGRASGMAGSYFDLICHSFTVNIWLPALAFGVYQETQQPLVMLLGIAAMPALSNFSQLVGSWMFGARLVAEPDLLRTEQGRTALEQLSGRHRQVAAVQSGVLSRRGLAKVAKEIIGYPGMILVIIVCTVWDALTGMIWARLGIILVLTGFHGANNIRRTALVAKAFARIK